MPGDTVGGTDVQGVPARKTIYYPDRPPVIGMVGSPEGQ